MLWKPTLPLAIVTGTLVTSAISQYHSADLFEARDDLTVREDFATRVLLTLATRRYGVNLEQLFKRDAAEELNKKLESSEIEVTTVSSKIWKRKFSPQSRQNTDGSSTIGIWKSSKGARVWKVYKDVNTARKVAAHYETASASGLPLGNWEFHEAFIRLLGPTPEIILRGGVIMTQNHATGYHFDGAADGSFKLALEKCNFPKDKTSPDYLKLMKGLEAAKQVGLQNPEGFLNPGAQHPLVFIDIITTGQSTKMANTMLRVAKEWGESSAVTTAKAS